MTNFDFIVNRWLVGSGSGHCEELMVSIVSGLQLTIASASTMKVLKDSSSSWVLKTSLTCIFRAKWHTFLFDVA